jgi:uncharacterized protein YdhG (YjbR/CyaY superfamily)
VAQRFASVDEYLGTFPEDVRAILQEIRRTIRAAVPGCGEKISYGMPTITLDDRYVVYFAGWKHHISMYPIPAVDDTLAGEIAPYLAGKGTLRFPLSEPMPYELIGRLAALLARTRADRP